MQKKFWTFKNSADEEAELLLYGEISDASWYGDEVTPKQFAEDLSACEGKALTVRVNSPGGDVFAAQAIYNQLKAYAGKVTVRIDGICASAATVIACAGDTVVMPRNTIYMIHNPKSAMLGYFDAVQLSKVSDRLSAVKQTIVNVYMERVQHTLSEVQVKHKMDNEEWITADKAKEYGFVDEIGEEIPIENRWKDDILIVNSVACKLDRFKNVTELRAVLPEQKEKRSEFLMTITEKWDAIKNIVLGGDAGAAVQNAAQTTPAVSEETTTQSNAEDVRAAAALEERARMAALDAMKNGNPAADSIIEAAKKNGASAESVKPYVDAVQNVPEKDAKEQDKEKMLAAIQAIMQDTKDSGAGSVLPSPQAGAKNEMDEKAASISDIANCANRMRGVN